MDTPTTTASRRFGGADLVREETEDARSDSGSVGKKIRKSRTLQERVSRHGHRHNVGFGAL